MWYNEIQDERETELLTIMEEEQVCGERSQWF